jgi:Histidine phosphatase superfamily (branch 1)
LALLGVAVGEPLSKRTPTGEPAPRRPGHFDVPRKLAQGGARRRACQYGQWGRGRQLDEVGVASACAMGEMLRRLRIPIDQILSSPTYRALETVRYAKLGKSVTLPVDLDTDKGPWYRSIGQGMGAALNVASASNAYVLSDRPSWLHFSNKGDLKILVQGDPRMFNQYSVILVNPIKHPGLKRTQRNGSSITGISGRS